MSGRDFNAVMAERIRYYLKKNKMNQSDLARMTGVGNTTVSNWCKGNKTPRAEHIDAMCRIFGCARADLVSDGSGSAAISVPVYGRVAAGIPLEMIEDIIDHEDISSDMAERGEYFGLRLHGDSMEPKMSDGDVVIVRCQDDAETGDIVIATVNGTDATCKRLKKYRDGIELIAMNPSYPPLFYTTEEVVSKPVKIIGRVVELRAKF